MSFRSRLQKLLRQVPAVCWCQCSVAQMIVRFPGDPEPAEAKVRDAEGRLVCGGCGLPHPPGPLPQVVILMPKPDGQAMRRIDAATGPGDGPVEPAPTIRLLGSNGDALN
ncbi:MAG TPA: hypothetical protein VMS17_30705 [Gemmataceae bacterium]|nr:hypothetical protein [Gemmataceae bacterium]